MIAPGDIASFLSVDISQQWMLMAAILTIYFLKDKLFDEVAMAKFFAQRRVAKSCNKRAIERINSVFPTAVSGNELVALVKKTLKEHGFRRATTQLAVANCPDVHGRNLGKKFEKVYGDHVPMGGLAGFAFGGVRSFGEVVDSMIYCGDAFIMYGPHMSVNADGAFFNECQSAKKAADYVANVRKGAPEMKLEDAMEDGLCVDVEQYFLQDTLMSYGDRLENAKDVTELPMVLFDAQTEMMEELVSEGCKQEDIQGFVCLLGGIQINTPSGVSDYFLPLKFELRDKEGELIKDLMW
mmetsp:Transcript_21867/g.37191  ORF Transcript_21867/g.37191 Transcript_21867/m.37191 type:complete len:296 (-) Transcript_21867:103-990(-)|eukprot:CAMPEP_0116540666 /NCGR_PEP_ID=MMETSP0397-20121206/72_1 /TAXON_ID=216820 /ORGANISM="Cyclophora tenuis, Strain ECT3854" /LENGTH=295 /DNA_ID=CAMNT_0004064559 /DNA_START=256 /DNA_END=1143 /DNA_ORIENTATION=-